MSARPEVARVSGDERPVATEVREAPDPLLSIGVFARRSRLSPKALRLYERLGLLVPAQVDRGNGYRRYRESQLATARLVALLRRLDMPLAQVAEVVSTPGPRGAALLAAYWESVERRVAFQRELALHLRSTLVGGDGRFDMFQVRERDVPEQTELTEQRHIRVAELPGWIGSAMDRLVRAAEGHGGAGARPSSSTTARSTRTATAPSRSASRSTRHRGPPPTRHCAGSPPTAPPTSRSPRPRSNTRRSSPPTTPSPTGSASVGWRWAAPPARSTSPTSPSPPPPTRSATSPSRCDRSTGRSGDPRQGSPDRCPAAP